jgi:hypothetical protein
MGIRPAIFCLPIIAPFPNEFSRRSHRGGASLHPAGSGVMARTLKAFLPTQNPMRDRAEPGQPSRKRRQPAHSPRALLNAAECGCRFRHCSDGSRMRLNGSLEHLA